MNRFNRDYALVRDNGRVLAESHGAERLHAIRDELAAEGIVSSVVKSDLPRSPANTQELRPYVSTMSERFAPGNFVTTWNPELGRNAVGVTRAIADVQEANPLLLVKWMHDLSEEWIRSEYVYLAR